MAGGVGSRFWPVSTQNFPKQFHDMLGTGETLIQKTFSRLSKIIPTENILVLTNASYAALVKEQLPQVKDAQVVLEPAMRNTAPCILMAALKIYQENKDAVMIVAPSDHWIEDEMSFSQNVKTAFEACQQNKSWLMTLGIQPTLPHIGYGYIKFRKAAQQRIYEVMQFTEKPDYKTAKSFLSDGNYLWNAGIFIWSVQGILAAFEQHLPNMYTLFNSAESIWNTEREADFVNAQYAKAKNISIDYGILEKSKNVRVLPADFDWSDLGSWGALYDKLHQEKDENVIINARVLAQNSKRNIIRTGEKKYVVIKDLNDYIVVDNQEVLLICRKQDEQEIKKLRNLVKEDFGDHLI
jgi:mannose-1-phosphate guanylyltransferase